jgi:DNA primase catalytic core
MSNISDWIKYELYPSLFEVIDRALPEHNFKRYSGGWRSNTYLDGSQHKRADKTVITNKAPGLILEQGGEALSIIDYVMRRDRVGLIEAVKYLAKITAQNLPNSSPEEVETYRKSKEKTTLLEACNSYFNYMLTEDTTEEEKDKVIKYLTSRGYSIENIKTMELGYIPSQDRLFKYLKKNGYELETIEKMFKPDSRIGTTHRLTIPYRSGGNIKGFKFRTLGDSTPKYLNSTDLDKSGGFFNITGLRGDKDLIIVEGELDSLHATARGLENIVALGGSSINSDQIKDSIKRGAKQFTICLDREKGKEQETTKKINSAIDTILRESNKIFIAELPDLGKDKTDPDSYIKEKGIENFKEIIARARPYYKYKEENLVNRYLALGRDLTDKEIEALIGEIIETANRIKDPIARDRFIDSFMKDSTILDLGITEESLRATADSLKYKADKETQAKEFSKLLSDITRLQDKGETDKALELLDKQSKQIKLIDKAKEFNSLLIPVNETELIWRLQDKPDSLNSGYRIGGEDLLLPTGAISIFTAPTSHGKTTLLLNLALNVAQTYQDKETYFFSYEEDRDTILLNALNSYIGAELSKNNRKSLKTYFTIGSKEFINTSERDGFIKAKDKFFNELINTGRLRINYSYYDSDTLIEAIRYLHKNTKIGSVFIDYIQLLNLPEGKYKTYSRQEEVKEICIALKDLAVETGLPIILGAQFNREVKNLLQLHPTNIGEAGDIERIANLIVGFWNNNFKPEGSDKELKEIKGKGYKKDTLYTTVLKNRGGKVGLEEILNFNGNSGVIKNINSLIENNPLR